MKYVVKRGDYYYADDSLQCDSNGECCGYTHIWVKDIENAKLFLTGPAAEDFHDYVLRGLRAVPTILSEREEVKS